MRISGVELESSTEMLIRYVREDFADKFDYNEPLTNISSLGLKLEQNTVLGQLLEGTRYTYNHHNFSVSIERMVWKEGVTEFQKKETKQLEYELKEYKRQYPKDKKETKQYRTGLQKRKKAYSDKVQSLVTIKTETYKINPKITNQDFARLVKDSMNIRKRISAGDVYFKKGKGVFEPKHLAFHHYTPLDQQYFDHYYNRMQPILLEFIEANKTRFNFDTDRVLKWLHDNHFSRHIDLGATGEHPLVQVAHDTQNGKMVDALGNYKKFVHGLRKNAKKIALVSVVGLMMGVSLLDADEQVSVEEVAISSLEDVGIDDPEYAYTETSDLLSMQDAALIKDVVESTACSTLETLTIMVPGVL